MHVKIPDAIPEEHNISTELISFQEEYLSQASMAEILNQQQQSEILKIFYKNKVAFFTTEEPIGNVTGHDIKI